MPTDTLIEITYFVATVLFILSLKWLSSPKTARHGVLAGEIGMALAIWRNAAVPRHRRLQIGGHRLGARLHHRRAAGKSGHDRRAAADRAEPCLRRMLCPSRSSAASEFYLRSPNIPPFMMAVLSMEVILGSLTFTGSLMAAGKPLQEILPQRPITYKGQNFVNLGMLALARGASPRCSSIHPEQIKLFPAMIIIPLIFGVDAGHSHRRRRHAHGHFAAEFLRGTFRGGHGFRAR